MARYITVPGRLDLTLETKTGPTVAGFTFAVFIRSCCSAREFIDSCGDAFEAIDLRTKLPKGAEIAGRTIELSDKEHGIIAARAKNPPLVNEVIWQVESFMRAVCDAPSATPTSDDLLVK